MKNKLIRKITFTALLTVLVVIFTKLLSIQNPPFFFFPPFVRVSIGPALIIFASLYLGPLFGGLVGILSDVLGWVAFNPSGLSFSPHISIIYLLLGILPWVLNYFLKKISFLKIEKNLFMGLFLLANLLLISFFVSNNYFVVQGQTYLLSTNLKIILSIVSIVLSALIVFITALINKKYEGTYRLATVVLLSEIILMTILGSFIKSYFFGASFIFILTSQIILLFINVPLNIFIIFLLEKILSKRDLI